MESRALEIIKYILELLKERDALREELEVTKGLLDGAIAAQETLKKKNREYSLK